MATRLKQLRLDEVSLVDRGANQHAHVALFKRDFSADDRERLASSGAALPDGSFPIENTGDLENAIRAIGRAKDPAKAKAHIISRARTLGATDKLPDGWVGKSIGTQIAEACTALFKSALSVFAEQSTTVDRQELLAESFQQFNNHLQGVAAAELAKAADGAAQGDAHQQEPNDMTDVEKAALEAKTKEDAALAKALAEIATMKKELALAKMSAKHKDFMDNLDGDKKDAFAAKSPDERDDFMSKNPIEKALPAAVQKMLDAAKANEVVLKALQEKDEAATFAKRATDLGLSAADGDTMRKAYAGDAVAVTKLEQLIKGLTEQVRVGKLFSEFGSRSQADAGSARARQDALAKDYQTGQIKIGKKVSIEQARAWVYENDPSIKKDLDDEFARRQRGV
jgi:hypothetical protein